MENKKYHTVKTVSKFNSKIPETESKSTQPKHKDSTWPLTGTIKQNSGVKLVVWAQAFPLCVIDYPVCSHNTCPRGFYIIKVKQIAEIWLKVALSIINHQIVVKKSKYGFYFYTTLFPKVSGKYNAHQKFTMRWYVSEPESKFLIEISCTNTQGNLFYKLDLSITIRRFKNSSGNTISTMHERVSYVQCYY